MVVPSAISEPAGVPWLITCPAGTVSLNSYDGLPYNLALERSDVASVSDFPTSLGTVVRVSSAPLLITIFMVDPLAAFVPASGSVDIT